MGRLGLVNGVPPFIKLQRRRVIPAMLPLSQYVGREIKHGAEIPVFPHKFFQLVFPHVEDFPHGKGMMGRKGTVPQFAQEGADAPGLFHHLRHLAQPVRPVRRETGEI